MVLTVRPMAGKSACAQSGGRFDRWAETTHRPGDRLGPSIGILRSAQKQMSSEVLRLEGREEPRTRGRRCGTQEALAFRQRVG
jgi:hypothetical protein